MSSLSCLKEFVSKYKLDYKVEFENCLSHQCKITTESQLLEHYPEAKVLSFSYEDTTGIDGSSLTKFHTSKQKFTILNIVLTPY